MSCWLLAVGSVLSKPEGRLQDASAPSSVLLLRWLVKGVLLGVVVYALLELPDLPAMARHALYALGMYGFIGAQYTGPCKG